MNFCLFQFWKSSLNDQEYWKLTQEVLCLLIHGVHPFPKNNMASLLKNRSFERETIKFKSHDGWLRLSGAFCKKKFAELSRHTFLLRLFHLLPLLDNWRMWGSYRGPTGTTYPLRYWKTSYWWAVERISSENLLIYCVSPMEHGVWAEALAF